MVVTGRQGFTWGKDLTFGDYSLSDIKRGWVSSTSWGVIFWSKTEASRKFQFTLNSPYRDSGVEVIAVTNAKMQELDFAGRNWEMNFQLNADYLTVADCKIGDELWTVIMAQQFPPGPRRPTLF